MSPLDMIIGNINSNPYFIGLMMLLLNLGGRFVAMEMTQGQEKFFQNPWVRRMLIFTILFVGTRNIVVALIMSFIIILCIGYLFNENSSLCIFRIGIPGSSCQESQPPAGGSNVGGSNTASLTKEELDILNKLQTKYKNSLSQSNDEEYAGPAPLNAPNISGLYYRNMDALQQSVNAL
jgi:hypothetical protein